MRKDKEKNKAKIIKAKLNNPLATEKELKDITGLGAGTINRHNQEVEKNGVKDDRILGICDKDIEIVNLAQNLILERLKDKKELEKVRLVEIAQIAKFSDTRYSIFKGDITDKDGGLKQLSKEDQNLISQALGQNI